MVKSVRGFKNGLNRWNKSMKNAFQISLCRYVRVCVCVCVGGVKNDGSIVSSGSSGVTCG